MCEVGMKSEHASSEQERSKMEDIRGKCKAYREKTRKMEEDGWAFGHAELEFKPGSSSYAGRLGYGWCVVFGFKCGDDGEQDTKKIGARIGK